MEDNKILYVLNITRRIRSLSNLQREVLQRKEKDLVKITRRILYQQTDNICISAKSITHMIYVDIPEVNMEDAQEFLKAIEY